jgi:hypothetical protein
MFMWPVCLPVCCGTHNTPAAAPSEPKSTSTRDADKTGVAYEERVTPLRCYLDAETCWDNLMSTIKNAYNALEHLLIILHRIMKNVRYNYQNSTFCSHSVFVFCGCLGKNKQRLFPYTALNDWLLNLHRMCLLRGTN